MDRKGKSWHCCGWLLVIAGCGKAEVKVPETSVITCAPLATETPFRSNCPNVRCGNDVIDPCARNGPQEQCDGNQLGGVTCADQGYRGGVIGCSSICQLDVRGCDSCADDARVTGCHHLPVSAPIARSIALATNPSEIAVAWNESVPPEASGWHFTRFQSDGSIIADTPCVGKPASGLSLVAMASGWLVASAGGGGTLELTRLDASGVVSSTSTADALNVASGGLVPAPGGTPLLAWMEAVPGQEFGGTLHLQPLDEQGEPTGSGVVIPEVSGWQGAGVDDGFSIAANLSVDQAHSTVRLFHLSLDGTLAAGDSLPAQSSVGGISLVWSDPDLRLIYLVGSNADIHDPAMMYLWHATSHGALIGSAQLIAAGPISGASAIALGGDTLVLHDQVLEGWNDSGPSAQWPELQVIHARAFVARLAEQGGDAILAWSDIATPLSIERVGPTP
jgi:hypothetical protein